MALEEKLTAFQYDRWMAKPGPLAAAMRFAMSPTGALFVNTPVFGLGRRLDLKPHHRLLDLGCGQGSIGRVLATKLPFDVSPVGLDVSSAMLRLGWHSMQRRQGPPMTLLQGSATTLPFADESFDLVVSSHTVKHLSDPALYRCLKEVLRVLKSGGAFVIWEFTPSRWHCLDRLSHRILTMEVTTAYLRTAGRLAEMGLESGFRQVRLLRLRPFLLPPIPRVSVLMRKGG